MKPLLPLPWEEVNNTPGQDVAALLGMKKAAEEGKWNCPVHGGSDSLHLHGTLPLQWACYACKPRPGGKFRAYSNVDLAASAWKVEAWEACKRLAEELRIPLEGEGDLSGILGQAQNNAGGEPLRAKTRERVPYPPTPGEKTPQRANTEALSAKRAAELAREFQTLRDDGYAPQLPPILYAEVLASCRILTTPEAWRELRELLSGYLPVELELAGLWKDGALRLPEEKPTIVLPKRGEGGEIVGLRFKTNHTGQ